ncbi:MAG: hypothetical protein KAJ64_00355 [Thermoplasmata archaeon]|nr:hypothetical protein [Thermoplasmata archaeon]
MPPDIAEPVILQGSEDSKPRTALIGCGGTGCNILVEGEVNGHDTGIAISSEPEIMKALQTDKILVDVRGIEKDATSVKRGARVASNETEAELAKKLDNIDVTFILGGLGGYTGGWGAVLAARAASIEKCISICIVSEPFSVEGGSRKDRAKAQFKRLMDTVDILLVIPNDMILAEAPNIPINQAFRVMNSVLALPANLILQNLGKDDLRLLKKELANSSVFAMDIAEWDKDNAVFAVVEKLKKSDWLMLEDREPASAILFVEGHLLYDDLIDLGKTFSRETGCQKVFIAKVGERKYELKVTAVIGF